MGINYGSLDITTTGAGTFSAVVMSSSTPSSITNTLYNDGGTLKFGSQVVYTDLSEIPEDLVPSFDGIFDLGSTTKKWFKGYFTSEIQIGNTATIQADVDDDIVINTNVIVQGISSATIGDFGDITISDNNIELNSSLGSYGPQRVNISPGLNVDGELMENGEALAISRVPGTCSVLSKNLGNTVTTKWSTISGGSNNSILFTTYPLYYPYANSDFSVIGGGCGNSINPGSTTWYFPAQCSTIGGGANNTINGGCSTIGGGANNTINERGSTISGGVSNYAAGFHSTVGGGCRNNATQSFSTVSGGWFNCATQSYSTISGGTYNCVNGTYSTISGGSENCATGSWATVSGGAFNCVTAGSFSTVGGGRSNTISASYSAILGGRDNTASAKYSYISGGYKNFVNARHGSINGGHYNVIQSPNNQCFSRGATIGGGIGHNTTGGTVNSTTGDITGTVTCCNAGAFSTISGGFRNIASGFYTTVGGGYANIANYDSSIVAGGASNQATCQASTVAGGSNNCSVANYTFIGGGNTNTASGCYSGVLGGRNSTVSHNCSFIVGACLTSTAACYTFVNNLCNVGGGTSDCRLKENIKTLTYGVKELSKLEPVAFNFKDDESKKTKYGFLAQCVQNVMPELIYHHPTDKVDNTPVLQFDKEAIWASMINAIKELHDKNIALEERIKKLENTK